MAKAVSAGVFPGGAYAVGTVRDQWMGVAGRHSYERSARTVDFDTVFDLASLTKVIATTTSAICLFQDGALDLDAKVVEYLPAFCGEGKQGVTIAHLLQHNSGLPAHRDFWKLPEEQRWEAILREPLEAAPGQRTLYSCVGFLVLQQVLQQLTGERYEDAWTWPFHRVAQSIGADLFFCPNPEVRQLCAPTEVVDGVALQGLVHDENSRSLGGIAGNAGLFGGIEAVSRFARMILSGGEGLIGSGVIQLWSQKQLVHDSSSTRALGWDTKSAEGSSAGTRFGSTSFGHTGFTGTSIWIDPQAGIYAVLLTNRVHPTRENTRIQAFRPNFHDCAFSLIDC